MWKAEDGTDLDVVFLLAATKTTTVGYGRHLLASAPAPASTLLLSMPKVAFFKAVGRMYWLYFSMPCERLKTGTKLYVVCLLAATKTTTVGYGRHLLASAPAPASTFLLSMPDISRPHAVGIGCVTMPCERLKLGTNLDVVFLLAATKTTTVGYGRHLLASAPAPASTLLISMPKVSRPLAVHIGCNAPACRLERLKWD